MNKYKIEFHIKDGSIVSGIATSDSTKVAEIAENVFGDNACEFTVGLKSADAFDSPNSFIFVRKSEIASFTITKM